MRLDDLRHLSGPNSFSTRPVTVARLELEELTGRNTTEYPGFAGRLTAALPGLAEHHCAAGRPGGFLEAMARGTYFGHVTEHVTLELSSLVGRDVHLGRTMWAGADGRYDVMTECPQDEPAQSSVPAELLELAITTVKHILLERIPDLPLELARIARVVERERLGVSTAALAGAARRRGIPVRRVGQLSMLRLGYGRYRRLVCAALTEQTSVIGVDIAADKMLAKQLLTDAGIPVPDGVVAWSAADAAGALGRLGGPVVIKPLRGSHGANVTVGVTTAAAAAAAYAQAAAGGEGAIVEKFVPGTDYRVLVVDGQVVAAAELRPASVTGDGASDITQLVDVVNADPRRGEGHSRELTKIKLDERALAHLEAQGLGPASVPARGQLVTLRRNANLSTGGTSRDVTDLVHEDVADVCRRAAAVVGLDICGIDVRLADIAAPMRCGGVGHGGAEPGAVIEINACPGLRMHLSPAEGAPRDVAGAVIDSLYPPGAPSRVPVVAVTGTNGKTTTVRMIGHILSKAGMRVGMSTTDGVYSGGRLVYDADASGPRSADMVLDDTSIEAAVLETARGGIIRGGLGYDQADVAVVTNITADHLGADGVEDLDELVEVKALVAEEVREGGTVVLNADDPVVAALADRPRVRRHASVIRYFSLVNGNPVIERHRQAGGLAYELRNGELVEFDADRERALLSVVELPGAFGGLAPHMIANALAAVAACRGLGVSAKDIRRALGTFTPGESNPGRGHVYLTGGGPVILDYGHNAAALDATGRMISDVWGGEPVAAITLPGDRRDDLVARSAEAVAAWFGRVVVYEDADKRGRRPGEMTGLITAAMRRARPGIGLATAEGPQAALRIAVTMAAGHPVLFVYEKLAMARQALEALNARPWPAGAVPPAPADAGPACSFYRDAAITDD
ncbi:cyanophycin synthetase [Microbispora sp. NEAU-D428]|uniref:cyanophycin synthetase n=1 Tax=Microbispora sitophila TaxID=2771537 RepID=UPI0018688BE8|nr:cyanophycin synthetase [Microbispora sitophila]MBE3010890.1 cyanophycin synthetase [Microbispora sitophila]